MGGRVRQKSIPDPKSCSSSGSNAVVAMTKRGSSPQAPVDLTKGDESVPTKKRKAEEEGPCVQQPKKAAKATPSSKEDATVARYTEKRLRRFRKQPPQTFWDVHDRALTQRFFVLGRTRAGTDDCPEEVVELTGSTGNIYTVNIGLKPSCNCPHGAKGNQCKHVLFVMQKVLNAPFDLTYQLALLSSELCQILAGAPPIDPPQAQDGGESHKRKPIEGDCPICFSELGGGNESIVWCRAACGQNMHQQCFETWARTKSGDVTCPMCRSAWEGDVDMVSRVEKSRGTASEGYVNVADQLGISQVRDESSYSRFYLQRRAGWRPGNGRWVRGLGGR